ncbi:hypothetical protein EG68_11056 [Paragonimus skrjabini miyazakii]|uniref:Uncharacterized protein n=1 Tax=Paragonimus skrjabini miyazakii TaxID=59628 RepID=A0A8S9YKB7_9TREM|nr:hypothetical protein EG68_11056 [Paragonimus skrjabini miyazakii]
MFFAVQLATKMFAKLALLILSISSVLMISELPTVEAAVFDERLLEPVSYSPYRPAQIRYPYMTHRKFKRGPETIVEMD